MFFFFVFWRRELSQNFFKISLLIYHHEYEKHMHMQLYPNRWLIVVAWEVETDRGTDKTNKPYILKCIGWVTFE